MTTTKRYQVQANANGVWVRAQLSTFSSALGTLDWIDEQIRHPKFKGAEQRKNWRVVYQGHPNWIGIGASGDGSVVR